MKVKVNWLNIKKGKPGNAAACPIANALLGKLKNAKRVNVEVGGDTADISFASKDGQVEISISAPLPPKAQQFIEKFDNREQVEPFEFDLKIPKDVKTVLGALVKVV